MSGKGLVGKRNGKWNGGCFINGEGYRRISSGKFRGWYEHKVVIHKLLESPVSYMFTPGQEVPRGFHIHHIDHIKAHNCAGNLMLLGKPIHDAISNDHKAYVAAHFSEYCAAGEEVPF